MHQDVLNPRVTRTFIGKVVRKDLLHQIKGGESADTVPRMMTMRSASALFQPLPKEFDLALIDRLHFYLPGWEVPKNSKDMLTGHYGFVTDYLAEASRTLRKQNRFDETEKEFRFGSHVEGQDATAAKKTVSGLLKILHPGGEWTKHELAEYVELALEGRRRVKEQLKKRGSLEFYKTSFSCIDQEAGIEKTVGVPEQGGLVSSPQIPCRLGRSTPPRPMRKQRSACSGSKSPRRPGLASCTLPRASIEVRESR